MNSSSGYYPYSQYTNSVPNGYPTSGPLPWYSDNPNQRYQDPTMSMWQLPHTYNIAEDQALPGVTAAEVVACLGQPATPCEPGLFETFITDPQTTPENLALPTVKYGEVLACLGQPIAPPKRGLSDTTSAEEPRRKRARVTEEATLPVSTQSSAPSQSSAVHPKPLCTYGTEVMGTIELPVTVTVMPLPQAPPAKTPSRKPHQCAQCGQRLASAFKLKLHMRSHTGERPHQCEVCSKTFHRRQTLVEHGTTHKAKKFSCATCGGKFLRREQQLEHLVLRLCKQQRRSRTTRCCPVCDMGFFGMRNHVILAHVRQQHPEHLEKLQRENA